MEATRGTTLSGSLRELFTIASNRYHLMLSIGTQVFQNRSGASSITIFAVEYFEMLGMSGSKQKPLATAVLGIVKLTPATLCAIFLIDFIGRKRSLLSGVTLQFIAMLYMALFLTIDSTAGDEDAPEQSPIQKRAATGAIAMSEWLARRLQQGVSLTRVMVYLSGVGYTLGWNSCSYRFNAESYPLRIRVSGSSFAMTFHFLLRWPTSKAVPAMFLGLTPDGTMFFFAAIILVGGAWAWFFLPELCGMSLEGVSAVFDLPWWRIGRDVVKVVEARRAQDMHESEKEATITRVEMVACIHYQ